LALVIFWVGSHAFCLGLSLDFVLLHLSWSYRYMLPCLPCWLRWGFLLAFCPGQPRTAVLPISIFLKTGITDVSHCAQLSFLEPFSLLLSNSLSSWEQLNTRDKF
jgi:hypothetical protein